MPLTDAKIRNTKPADKPLKLTDGGGLYLEVRPTGTRLWRLRYRIDGKENVFAIGGYPEIGLADARDAREKAKPLIRQGIHPSHNRQAERLANSAANANTFEAVAREWIKKKPQVGRHTTYGRLSGSWQPTSSPLLGSCRYAMFLLRICLRSSIELKGEGPPQLPCS